MVDILVDLFGGRIQTLYSGVFWGLHISAGGGGDTYNLVDTLDTPCDNTRSDMIDVIFEHTNGGGDDSFYYMISDTVFG